MGWRDVVFMLLAHHSREELSHTLRIPIGKKEIYLCARCTGIYSALFVCWLLFTFVIDLTIHPVGAIYGLAWIFGTPVVVAWSYQTITDNDNSNKIRVFTGIGGGIGLALLLYTPTPLRELSIFGIFGLVVGILYFGKIRRFQSSEKHNYIEDNFELGEEI